MKRKASTSKSNGQTKFVYHPFFQSKKKTQMNIMLTSVFFFCCFFDYIRRARKKRVSEDSDEDDEAGTAGDDSDVEMADANAHRKSDASEPEKQTRASRLSARTRAKVCYVPLVPGLS